MEEGIFRVSEALATPVCARSRPGSGKEARSPAVQNRGAEDTRRPHLPGL